MSAGWAYVLTAAAVLAICAAAFSVARTHDLLGRATGAPAAAAVLALCWWACAVLVRRDIERRRGALIILLIAAPAWMALTAVHAFLPGGNGLAVQYFANDMMAGAPVRAGVDHLPSTSRLNVFRNARPSETFSAVWSGFITTKPALYRFALTSDDGSRLFIDDRLVVDNSGPHGPLTKDGDARLTSGSHRVRLEYAQSGGSFALTWQWSADRGRVSRVPPWALSRKPTSYRAALTAAVVDTMITATIVAIVLAALWYVPLTAVGLVADGAMFVAPRFAARYRSRMALAFSTVVFLIMLLPRWGDGGLLWPTAATFHDMGSAASARMRRFPEPQTDLDTPRAGEDALGELPVEVLALMRRDGIDRYRLSQGFRDDEWLFQRVITSAWPRRLDQKAEALFVLEGELADPHCRFVDRLGEVTLVSCR